MWLVQELKFEGEFSIFWKKSGDLDKYQYQLFPIIVEQISFRWEWFWMKCFGKSWKWFTQKIMKLDESKLRNFYRCFRMFWRTSDTRALEKGAKKADIKFVNKQKLDENSKSNKTSLLMHLLYVQFNIFIGLFLRYTKEMWY